VSIPAYSPPRDNQDVVTSASIFTPMNQSVAYLNQHMNGQTSQYVRNHDDTMINVGVTLAEVPASQVQNPATQRIYNDGTWGALTKLLGNYAGSGFMGKMATMTDTIFGLAGLLRSHSHTDATSGGKLLQANTHQSPDTDAAGGSLHHTIGTGATQAAAGNHNHDTIYTKLTSAGVANGYATLDVGGAVPDAQIPNTIARDSEVAAAYIPLTQRAAASGVATLDTGTKVPVAQLPDLSATYVAVTQKGAASGVATLDGTTHIPDAQLASTIARQSDITTAVAGRSVYQHVHGGPGGELTIDGATGIAPFSLTSDRLLEGAVKPRTPNDSWVTVNAIRKWDINGNFINYAGEDLNLAGLFPAAGSGQSCYILIFVNSQPAARARQGPLVLGPINNAVFPTVGANETPLAFVIATAGMTTVGTGQLMGCRFIASDPNLQSGGGGSGSYAPLNHVHGQNNTSFITAFSMDEGRCYAFSTATMSINISPFHYRGSDGVVRQNPLASPAAFTPKPSTNNYRNDLVYFDTVNKVVNVLPGTEFSNLTNPSYPTAQANWMTLCYIHMTWNMTVIKDTNDGQNNGWIEDARAWANIGGPNTVASGAIDVGSGGTGANGFNQGLVWQSSATVSTTALTTVPASQQLTGTNTYGLGITPSIPAGTNASGNADVLQLGGGTVNTGGNALAMIAGVHIIPPVKSGAGQTTTGVALHVDAPNLATTTNNVSILADGGAVIAGAVRVGGTAMPGAGRALDVTGVIGGSSDLSIPGVSAFPSSPVAGQTCYRSDWRAWFMWDTSGTPGWRQISVGTFVAAFPPNPVEGLRCYRTDWNYTEYRYATSVSGWCVVAIEQQGNNASQPAQTTSGATFVSASGSQTNVNLLGYSMLEVTGYARLDTASTADVIVYTRVAIDNADATGGFPSTCGLWSGSAYQTVPVSGRAFLPPGAHTILIQFAIAGAGSARLLYYSYNWVAKKYQ
jgi:hypothetical protein